MIGENLWGTPSKVYISDKPIACGGTTDLRSDVEDMQEFNCEVVNFEAVDDILTQEQGDNGYKLDDFNKTISIEFKIQPKDMRGLRKMFRAPKLPRKLKKYVKKNYFDVYPKRAPRNLLNLAFAVNNPNKARKIGLMIVPEMKGGQQ